MLVKEQGRAFYLDDKWYVELAGGEHVRVFNPSISSGQERLYLGRDENRRVIVAVDREAPPNPPLRVANFVHFIW